MTENKIKWSGTSIKQFISCIDYIASDSLQNAENVKQKLLDKLERFARLPYTCPPDKYRLNNDGSFRAFTMFRYNNISYAVTDDGIEILRVRHTSMKPKYH